MKKLTHNFLFTVMLTGVSFISIPLSAYSQVELQRVAPLSPNVASLLRFTETNVSPYTGAAGINFPIYSLSSGSLKLDLSLGYNSTGNKITDVASWVGLGWNVSLFPVVTRSIRSQPDESTVGISTPYLGTYKIEDIIRISKDESYVPGTTGTVICEIAKGTLDTEPDFFHYTLLDGRSGYFYWDPYQEKYETYPYRDLKINRQGNGIIDQIEIVDDYGNIYLFGDWETSQSSGYYAGATERNAWYVSKIYNSNRSDNISFGYSQQTTVTRTLNPMKNQLSGYCADNSSKMSVTTQVTKIPYSIYFAGGKVHFTTYTSDREDLDGARALKTIEVVDNKDSLIKRFGFQYMYTTGSSADPLCQSISSYTQEKKRMFLTGFAEYGSNVTDSIKYTFEYDNNKVIPCRLSSAQDFWGYYNGKTDNTDLVPEIPVSISNSSSAIPGADRFINISVNQFGMLKKINYPTGGYAEYEYETHQVSDANGELPGVYITTGAYLTPEHETSTNTFVDTILIYSDQDLFINNSSAGGSSVDIKLGDKDCVEEPLTLDECALFYVRGIDTWNSDVNFTVSYDINAHLLKKGRYEIKAIFQQQPIIEQGFFLFLKWRERDTTFVNKYIGGLRVKEVRITDGLGNQYSKKYFYTNSLSTDSASGCIISGTDFFRYHETSCADNLAFYYVADNNATQTSHGGSYAGYSNVFEVVDQNQGYTQYQYNHQRDYVSNKLPFVPAYDRSEWRGQLVNKKVFKKIPTGFKLLSEERNFYDYAYVDSVAFSALKIFIVAQNPCPHDETGSPGLIYLSEVYSYAPIVSKLTRHQSVFFNQDNEDSLVTQQQYYYKGFSGLVERIVTTSSKNKTIEEYTYYPTDYTNSGNTTAICDTMINRHMVAVPLRKISMVDGNMSSTLINKYAQSSGNGFMQLRELWHSYRDNTPEARALFNYSSEDKLIEQQKVNDVKEVYLWGYNSQYPVARILNSTHAIASGYITQSMLDNPSSDQALRNHLANLRTIPETQVTTYTYKPLVGITSETDPGGRTTYYEYDYFNRLSIVRDKDNNIIKKICYNYAGQPETCGAVITYSSVATSGDFTRSCSEGGVGATVTYTIPAGTFTSTVSQADADQQAINAVNAGGQAYANANAVCTWTNQVQSGSFTRNNCENGGTGGTVTYTVAASTYSSATSLADANQQAINAVNAGGQEYANATAGCTWYNQAISQAFTRNNCPVNYVGESAIYSVAANTYS